MTNEEICDRYRQWAGRSLSEEEEEELEELITRAATELTDQEHAQVLAECEFPIEILGLSDEDMARLREGSSGDGIIVIPSVRIQLEALRRYLAAKQAG